MNLRVLALCILQYLGLVVTASSPCQRSLLLYTTFKLITLNSVAWISLNMTAPLVLPNSNEHFYSNVPVMIGSPPQEVDMTVNTYSILVAAFAYDCNLCAGNTFFDHSQSSSFRVSSFPTNFIELSTYFKSHFSVIE
jgi:hypothetical protein